MSKNNYDVDFMKPYHIKQRKGKNVSTDKVWDDNKVWYKEGDKVYVMNRKGESKTYIK